MEIKFSGQSYSSLVRLVNFIESKNSTGAGLRWLHRFDLFLKTSLVKPDAIRLCNNKTFNKMNLHCIYFNDWVIAFSVLNNFVLIEELLHSSRITD